MKKNSSEISFHPGVQLDDSERQVCEIWTRVMGYHRPLSSFNKGKRSEHSERLHFQEKVCLSSSK